MPDNRVKAVSEGEGAGLFRHAEGGDCASGARVRRRLLGSGQRFLKITLAKRYEVLLQSEKAN
jgi:hypothetical protein